MKAIREILDERQKRAGIVHDKVLAAREAIRANLSPDSPEWLRTAFNELHAIHHILGGDPFQMHMEAALGATYDPTTQPFDEPLRHVDVGFDATPKPDSAADLSDQLWELADRTFHDTALVADDGKCVEIIARALKSSKATA